jgi:hypothetical protein
MGRGAKARRQPTSGPRPPEAGAPRGGCSAWSIWGIWSIWRSIWSTVPRPNVYFHGDHGDHGGDPVCLDKHHEPRATSHEPRAITHDDRTTVRPHDRTPATLVLQAPDSRLQTRSPRAPIYLSPHPARPCRPVPAPPAPPVSSSFCPPAVLQPSSLRIPPPLSLSLSPPPDGSTAPNIAHSHSSTQLSSQRSRSTQRRADPDTRMTIPLPQLRFPDPFSPPSSLDTLSHNLHSPFDPSPSHPHTFSSYSSYPPPAPTAAAASSMAQHDSPHSSGSSLTSQTNSATDAHSQDLPISLAKKSSLKRKRDPKPGPDAPPLEGTVKTTREAPKKKKANRGTCSPHSQSAHAL